MDPFQIDDFHQKYQVLGSGSWARCSGPTPSPGPRPNPGSGPGPSFRAGPQLQTHSHSHRNSPVAAGLCYWPVALAVRYVGGALSAEMPLVRLPPGDSCVLYLVRQLASVFFERTLGHQITHHDSPRAFVAEPPRARLGLGPLRRGAAGGARSYRYS